MWKIEPYVETLEVISALLDDSFGDANRYNFIDPLVDAIARHEGMPAENVLVGCGSTEFLQFTPWAYLKDGGNIVLPTPSYGWSAGVAVAMGREAIRVPLGKRGVVDTAAMIGVRARIIYGCRRAGSCLRYNQYRV